MIDNIAYHNRENDILIEDIALKINTKLHDCYLITEHIAIGHNSIVYKGLKEKTPVLIKEFCPWSCANRDLNGKDVVIKGKAVKTQFEEAKSAFLLETKVVHTLDKLPRKKRRNIATYIDSFEENDTWYLVTEFIEGTDLETMLRRCEEIPYKKVIRSLIGSIRSIHKLGILHRDIKPSNMIIDTEGNLVLIDFGSACFMKERNRKSYFISRGYSALELYEEQQCTAKTDIYSIGILIYYLTTGVLPESATLRKVKDTVLPLYSYQQVPAVLNYMVMKAIRVSADERLSSLAILFWLFI